MMFVWYINTDDTNKINKTPVEVLSENESTIYEDTSILTPVLRVKHYDKSYNYVKITQYNRYYFVTDVIYSRGYYLVRCKCDVLYTYRTEINNLNLTAYRTEVQSNNMLADNALPLEIRKKNIIKPFGQGIPYNNNGRNYVVGVKSKYIGG